MEAVREASAALQALPAGIGLQAWMWDSPALPEEPATQQEIQHTIAAERRRRAAPRFTTGGARRRQVKSSRRRPRRGLFEDLFTWLEGKL
jgi:hypothetical protein